MPVCLNRTFMELKLYESATDAYGRFGLNRTFMELKYRGGGASVNVISV